MTTSIPCKTKEKREKRDCRPPHLHSAPPLTYLAISSTKQVACVQSRHGHKQNDWPPLHRLHITLMWAGTFQCLGPQASPSLPGHMSPWNTARISAHADICSLSSPLPSTPLSKAPAVRLSTGCNRGSDAAASGLSFLPTTNTYRPRGVRIVSGKFSWTHAHSSVCRTWLSITSNLSLGWVSRFWLCPSVCNRSDCSTCRPPTKPSPPSFLLRSI